MSDTTERTIDRSKLQVSDEVAIEINNMNKQVVRNVPRAA